MGPNMLHRLPGTANRSAIPRAGLRPRVGAHVRSGLVRSKLACAHVRSVLVLEPAPTCGRPRAGSSFERKGASPCKSLKCLEPSTVAILAQGTNRGDAPVAALQFCRNAGYPHAEHAAGLRPSCLTVPAPLVGLAWPRSRLCHHARPRACPRVTAVLQ